jgi:hypothetical protein
MSRNLKERDLVISLAGCNMESPAGEEFAVLQRTHEPNLIVIEPLKRDLAAFSCPLEIIDDLILSIVQTLEKSTNPSLNNQPFDLTITKLVLDSHISILAAHLQDLTDSYSHDPVSLGKGLLAGQSDYTSTLFTKDAVLNKLEE